MHATYNLKHLYIYKYIYIDTSCSKKIYRGSVCTFFTRLALSTFWFHPYLLLLWITNTKKKATPASFRFTHSLYTVRRLHTQHNLRAPLSFIFHFSIFQDVPLADLASTPHRRIMSSVPLRLRPPFTFPLPLPFSFPLPLLKFISEGSGVNRNIVLSFLRLLFLGARVS